MRLPSKRTRDRQHANLQPKRSLARIFGQGSHISRTANYCLQYLEYLAGGMTETESLEDFSELTLQVIKARLTFAADREKIAN